MTDEQHRTIGAILGFPACCVEAWIADRNMSGVRRGSITLGWRSWREAYRLHERVSRLLGRPWGVVQNPGNPGHRQAIYVPCGQCAAERERAS